MREVLGIQTVYFFQNEDTKYNNFHFWLFPRYEWMEKVGRKIESVKPIIIYAEKNMATNEVCGKVKEVAAKMREYMKDFEVKI